MAISDPLSITVGADTFALARTGFGQDSGTFRSSDGDNDVVISHKYGNRVRHSVRFNHSQLVADELVDGLSRMASMSVMITVDTPKSGYELAAQRGIVEALVSMLTASSSAQLVKILGGES